MTSRRQFLAASVGIGATTLAGCFGPDTAAEIQSLADDLADYAELGAALADDYRSAARYVYRTDDGTRTGGLGEVFVDDTHAIYRSPDEIDPERPHLLFYRLSDTGTYEWAGMGWSVPAADRDEPPELFGATFRGPEPGYLPDQHDHYYLHAWPHLDEQTDITAAFPSALSGPSWVEDLEHTRSSLTPFQIGDDAIEDGYHNTEEHIFTDDGLYGVPFVDHDTDYNSLERPPILLYRMTDAWYYELLGVEWSVRTETVTASPTLLEQPFHDPLPGHSPEWDQGDHYGLHAWLFRANPDGMFDLYNDAL